MLYAAPTSRRSRSAGGKGGESLLQQKESVLTHRLAGFTIPLQQLCLRRLNNMRASEERRPSGPDTDKDTGYMTGYVMYTTHPAVQNVLLKIALTER